MTLNKYGFGVAILACGIGCGGTIAAGSNGTKDSGVKETSAVDSGTDILDSAMPVDSSDAGADTGPADAGADHGAPSTTYPAFTPFMPPIIDNGGPVIAAPEIVTISWLSDSSHTTWEAFGDAVGSSTYWTTTTSEYGVGPAVSGPTRHVELSIAEPTWSDSDVANFVMTNASDTATSGWPAPTSNTLYTIYLPQSTASTFTLNMGSQSVSACGGGGVIGGYHNNVPVTGVGDVAYAVVIQCPGLMTTDITEFASHELIEAVTDAHPNDIPAYYGVDDSKYYAWDIFQAGSGTEVGDMCEVYFDSFFVDPVLTYGVQRTWSNASATAGHAPCVPAAAGPYFNVTPLNQEPVTVDESAFGGSTKSPALGYAIPVGKTRTFQVGFYSDADTGGPWQIKAKDYGDPLAGYYFNAIGTSAVTVSTDVTQGQNGQVAYVTVTVNSVDQTKTDLVILESVLPGSSCGGFGPCRHYMPILISSN